MRLCSKLDRNVMAWGATNPTIGVHCSCSRPVVARSCRSRMSAHRSLLQEERTSVRSSPVLSSLGLLSSPAVAPSHLSHPYRVVRRRRDGCDRQKGRRICDNMRRKVRRDMRRATESNPSSGGVVSRRGPRQKFAIRAHAPAGRLLETGGRKVNGLIRGCG